MSRHPVLTWTLRVLWAAVADIIAGLFFEAIAALAVFIMVALFRAAIRKRYKVTARG